jgi:hypothetical protein
MKMKEIVTMVFLASLLVLPSVSASPKSDYNTITEGEIMYSSGHYLAGQPIPTGFDDYGYNYQGHLFKGSYFNVYSGGAGFPPYVGDDESYLDENPGAASHWAWPYRSIKLVMKWNDAWLSNVDRDDDGMLDRHYGFSSYIGSGAWETNHMWGSYIGDDGKEHKWNSFTKIVAAPSDAYTSGDYWYEADGTEMGTVIWGQFAVIFDVYNDPYDGYHGVSYDAPAPTGFGYYKP